MSKIENEKTLTVIGLLEQYFIKLEPSFLSFEQVFWDFNKVSDLSPWLF
jgi:hypothetical protein